MLLCNFYAYGAFCLLIMELVLEYLHLSLKRLEEQTHSMI